MKNFRHFIIFGIIFLINIVSINSYSQLENLKTEVGYKKDHFNGYIYVFGKSKESVLHIYKLDENLSLLDSVSIEDKTLTGNRFEVYYSPLGIEVMIIGRDNEILGLKYLTTSLIIRDQFDTDEYIRYFDDSFYFYDSDYIGIVQIDRERILKEIDKETGMANTDFMISNHKKKNPFSKLYDFKGDSKLKLFSYSNGEWKESKEIQLDNKFSAIKTSSGISQGKINLIGTEANNHSLSLIELNLNGNIFLKTTTLTNNLDLAPMKIFYWKSTEDFYFLFRKFEQKKKNYSNTYQFFKLSEDKTLVAISDSKTDQFSLPAKIDLTLDYTVLLRKNGVFINSKFCEYVSSERSYYKTYAFSETKIDLENRIDSKFIFINDDESNFAENERKNINLDHLKKHDNVIIYNNQIYHLAKDRILSKISNSNQDLIIINFDQFSINRKNWYGKDKFPLTDGAFNNYYNSHSKDFASIMIQSYDEEKILICKLSEIQITNVIGASVVPKFKVEIVNTSNFITKD